MSNNVDRVRSNIQKMVDGGADEIEINQYLKTEGFTPDSFARAVQVSSKAGKSTAEYGAGRAALQGLTFNTADEIEAALRSYAGQGTYEQNLAALKLAKEEYEKQNPKTAIAAEIVGGLPYAAVPFLGAARYAKMAQTASPAMKAAVLTGANIGTGAVTGGLAGAGSADIGQRVAGAGTGAAVGGAVGGAIPAVSATAGKLGQKAVDVTAGIPVVQRIGQGVGALTGQSIDYANRAKEKLLEAMSRDKVTPSEIEDVLRSITKPVGLPDIAGENVRSLADVVQKYPSAARQQGRQALEERAAGQAERIKSDISNYLGEFTDPFAFTTQVAQRQRQTSSPLYKSAYQYGEVTDPEVLKFLELPQFKQAFKEAEKLLAAKGEQIDMSRPTVEALDNMKQGLDALIEAQTDSVTGKMTKLGVIYKNKKNEFLTALDEAVPDYGKARQAFAGDAEIMDATRNGQNFFKLTPDQAKREFASLSPSEQEAYRIGAIDSLKNNIEKAKDTADVRKRIFGSVQERERLKTLFPDEESFNAFARDMTTEAAMRRTQEKILGNSATVERQLAAQGLEMEPTFFSQIFEQGPVKGSLNYLRAQGQGVAGQTAEELSPFLFTLGNQEKNILNMQALKEYEQELLRRAALKASAT
ncbi:MAG: hypothetical protein ACO222_05270, partial [Polynucleobacter sp.]